MFFCNELKLPGPLVGDILSNESEVVVVVVVVEVVVDVIVGEDAISVPFDRTLVVVIFSVSS